jgi:hypothetical protein
LHFVAVVACFGAGRRVAVVSFPVPDSLALLVLLVLLAYPVLLAQPEGLALP